MDAKRHQSWNVTHVKEGLFADVFGGSERRRSHQHRLHLRQVNVASAVRVLPGVVVSQLRREGTLASWRRRPLHCSLNVPLTWCFVMSNTNQRGFQAFRSAPRLYRTPS